MELEFEANIELYREKGLYCAKITAKKANKSFVIEEKTAARCAERVKHFVNNVFFNE